MKHVKELLKSQIALKLALNKDKPMSEILQKEIDELNDTIKMVELKEIQNSYTPMKDYELLFNMLDSHKNGVPCFVDYSWKEDEAPFRDIARVRKTGNRISIGARGIQYGGVDEFQLKEKTQLEFFKEECERLGLEFYFYEKKETNNEIPKYKHNCDNCIFLGNYKEHDLYFCENEPTVIARYSSRGPDYTSGLSFATEEGNVCLFEAKKRAIEKGLIS